MVLHLIIFSLEWHESGLINTEDWNALSSAKWYPSKFRLWLIKGQSTKKQNKTKGFFFSVCQPEFPWKSIIKKQKNKTGWKDPEPSSINLEFRGERVATFPPHYNWMNNTIGLQVWFQSFILLQMWYEETRDQINLCDQGSWALFGPRWQHLPKTPVSS